MCCLPAWTNLPGRNGRFRPSDDRRRGLRRHKDDIQDARAIWKVVQQPGVKTVAVKSEEQQAVLALHRMRQ